MPGGPLQCERNRHMSDETGQSIWDFLEDDALRIPGVKSTAHPEGRDYIVPSPDAETGLFLQQLTTYMAKRARAERDNPDAEPTEADKRTEASIEAFLVKRTAEVDGDDQAMQLEAAGRLVLGTAVTEMLADGVSFERIRRVSRYAMLHFTQGPEAAKAAALSGAISGGALAPANRAARRAKVKPKGKGKAARR